MCPTEDPSHFNSAIKMANDSETAIPRGAQFHENIARNWRAGYASGSFKHRLELFNAILDRSVTVGQLWLDLGCGSGVLTSELVRRGARVVAVDGSPSMLEAARLALDTTAGELITFRQGDVQDLSWSEPCTFDGVLCSSVVEYVDDQDVLIEQVGRVLKVNGLLIISMPPAKSLVRTAQKLLRLLFKLIGKDRYAYLEVSRFEIDPGTVVGWLQEVNLRIDRVSNFDPVLSRHMLKICRPALLIFEARKIG